MPIKRALPLFGLLVLLWFIACESPVSTEIKSGNLSRTEYAVYTSADRIYDPAWSPDGSQIAFVWQSYAQDIYKVSADNDTLGLVKRFYERINTTLCAISPDEQYIIYYDYPNSYLYVAAQDTSILINSILPTNASQIKWSRDSRNFYYLVTEGSKYYLNCASREGVTVFSVALDSARYVSSYSIAPDGQSIVWSGLPKNQQPYQLWMYTPEQGQQKLLAADSILYFDPLWSPDGNEIFYTTVDRTTDTESLNIYSITNNSSLVMADSIEIYNETAFEWSEDGQKIYYIGDFKNNIYKGRGLWTFSLTDNNIQLNFLYDIDYIIHLNADGSFYISPNYDKIYCLHSLSTTDKKRTNLIPETFGQVSRPAWSPDGASLVYSHGKNLYKIPAAGGTPVALRFDQVSNNNLNHPDFSPDGSTLVFDNGNYIYTVPANGGQAKIINSGNYKLTYPVWSPDGKQIACTYYRDYEDSLIIFDYADGKLTRAQAWPGRYTSISWSKPHPVFGSYLLLAKAENPEYSGSASELFARNPETGKILKFFGKGGSFDRFAQYNLYACWAPDAETIAWIQRDKYSVNNYTLNIARIFVDLQ